MKKSLTINATRDGKKVSKSLGFVNPDVANSLVGGFAQMVNALSNDTFVNSQVVKVMDTTEEEQGGGSAPAGKQEGIITVDGAAPTYNGDGKVYICTGGNVTEYNLNDIMPVGPDDILFAPATDNYTAAVWYEPEADDVPGTDD